MTCDGAAGGGMVTATVNGQFEVVRVKIDKSVVDPNDIGMLEDLVTAAVNAAVDQGPRDEQGEDGAGDGADGAACPGMPGCSEARHCDGRSDPAPRRRSWLACPASARRPRRGSRST